MREIDESQKMRITLMLKPSLSDNDIYESCLEMLKNEKTEFYELKTGEAHLNTKTLCLHHNYGLSKEKPDTLLIELLVNNFSLSTFIQRQFLFNFETKGSFRFSG